MSNLEEFKAYVLESEQLYLESYLTEFRDEPDVYEFEAVEEAFEHFTIDLYSCTSVQEIFSLPYLKDKYEVDYVDWDNQVVRYMTNFIDM